MAKTTAFFTATYEGFETVEEDVEKHRQKIEKISSDALSFLGTEMTKTLQKHIQEDWHDAWGKPKKYRRRTDTGGLGLGSDTYITPTVSGLTLEFTYSPKGDHTKEEWHTRDGDDIIEVIQKNSGWSWQPKLDQDGRAIMPRPFWDKFVEEEKNSGIWEGFSAGFRGHGYTLVTEGANADVEFGSNEGMLAN